MLADDVLAIHNVRSLYGDVIDSLVRKGRNDEDIRILRTVFTEDCVLDFDVMMGVYNGLDEIENLFGNILPSANAWMWHNFSSPIIEIDGDVAKGRWTLLAMNVAKGDEGSQPTYTYGRYTDTYARTADGWKFKHQYFLDETRR